MGKDIDWKETEWIVTQLRAKLAEDQPSESEEKKPRNDAVSDRPADAAPSSRTTYGYGEKKKRKKHRASQGRQSAAPVEEKEEALAQAMSESLPSVEDTETSMTGMSGDSAPVTEDTEASAEKKISESAPNAESVETVPDGIAPAEEPVEEAFAEKADLSGIFEDEQIGENVQKDAVAEDEGEELAKETEAAEETEQQPAPAAAEPLPTYRRAVPPQKRTALFASAYNRDLTVEHHAPARVAGKLSGKKASPAPKLRTDKEKQAEVTLENLMQDLFGPESLTWFSADAEQPSIPQPEEKPVTAKEAPEPETVPAEKEPVQEAAAKPTHQKKKTGRKKDAPKQEQTFDTITREMDGQMALVLPETGRPLALPAEEKEQRPRREDRRGTAGDEDQIDFFSAEGGEALTADPAQEKSEFKRSIEASEEDFRLLLELDYEEELGSAIGFEKIRAFHEEGVNGQPLKKRRRRSSEQREYEVQGQDTSLRKNYTKQKREHVVRLALSVLIMLLIVIYEKSSWMAALFGGFLDGEKYPATYILMGLQLLIVIAFFSRQRLWEGFTRILKFSPIDYSLCSVMLIATVIYHAVLIFLPHEGAPSLYLSPAAMSIVLLALADLLDWYRESLAFQVISSRKQKYALIPRVSVGGAQGNARGRLMDDETAGTVWYVRPVGFVRNYFANTEKRIGHGRTLGVQLLLILAVGVAFGWYVLATGGSAEKTVQTVFVTFLLCVPVASLLITSLPMFFAACLRLGKKGAIIGEEPVYRCSGTTTLVMPDSEVFGAMHHEQFEVTEEEHYAQIAVLVRALLEKLQSPLCDSVNVERDRRIPPAKVILNEIEHDGIRATVGDERIEMLLGSIEYLQSYGVDALSRIGSDAEYGGKRLICVAVGGRAVAFFLARYRLNDDMSELLREMETEGVKVMIRTKDPGIRNDLFENLLPDRHEPVLVMKPTAREIDLRTDRVDATVVALGSCREASRTFVTCRRVRRAANFGKLFQVLSMAVGGAIAALLTFFGGGVGMSSFLVSLYLLFWSATHAVTSYFFLRERGDE